MLAYLLAGLGLVILLLAGDAMVRGAVNLSLRMGIPALIVSLTIVAFGTSAPELLISVGAILEGVPDIALGNVVGSNIANVLLVLGIPALIAGLHTSQCNTKKSYLIMIGVTLLFTAICFFGPIRLPHAAILLAVLALILWDQARDAMAHRADTPCAADIEDVEGADPEMSWWKIIVFLTLGLVGLPLGADLLIDGSVEIARRFHVSDTVIGLTLIAIGTSLPELATTVMAAFRKQADVALGNVIGSNIFNLLAIIGVAALVGPVPVDPVFLRFDLWVMIGAALLLIPFVYSSNRNLTKRWGILFSVLYVAYLWVVVANGATA